MPTNEFLPVAVAGVPNVEPQVDYAGSQEQVQGYPDGFSPPANSFNKMLRQATTIMSQIAQAVCDITGFNMPDDGDMPGLLSRLKSLFQLSASTNYGVEAGAANVYVVTLSPALTQFKAGVVYRAKIGSGHTNTGACTINFGAGAKPIKTLWGNDPPAGMIQAGSTYEFIDDGGTSYILAAMPERGQVFGGGAFPNYNGYVILPGGLIIQWVTIAVFGTVSLPIAFPNNFFAVVATPQQSTGLGSASQYASAYPQSLSTVAGQNSNIGFQCTCICLGN